MIPVVVCSAAQQLLLSGCAIGWPLNQNNDIVGNLAKYSRGEISVYSPELQYFVVELWRFAVQACCLVFSYCPLLQISTRFVSNVLISIKILFSSFKVATHLKCFGVFVWGFLF